MPMFLFGPDTTPAGGGGDAPAPPGDELLFSEHNFNRFTNVHAMYAEGGCGVGTDAEGLPNAQSTYGDRIMPNTDDGCNINNDNMSLTTGFGGTGKAMRSSIQTSGSNQNFTWLIRPTSLLGTMPAGGVGIRFSFKISSGGTPGGAGMKWLELKWAGHPTGRIQFAPDGWDDGVVRWSVVLGTNPGGTINRTQQALGPEWEDLNDGAEHEFVCIVIPNTTSTYSRTGGTNSEDETYSGGSSRDGRVAIWIDDIRVLDYSNDTIDVTPPGGRGVWCRDGDVDMIPAVAGETLSDLLLVDVVNASSSTFTLDHGDFDLWHLET